MEEIMRVCAYLWFCAWIAVHVTVSVSISKIRLYNVNELVP